MKAFWCALAGAVMLWAGSANAQESWSGWTDPGGKLTFEHPTGWTLTPQRTETPGMIRMYAGQADFGCQVWLLPREQTRERSREHVVQIYTRPIADTEWVTVFAPLREFRSGATATDISVDTSGVWPTQHALMHAGDQTAVATLQGRPGLELISLCMSYDGSDRTESFARLAASIEALAAP